MLNFKLDNLLLKMLKAGKNVSDLNLSCGRPPQVEIDSKLRPVEVPGLWSDSATRWCRLS